MEQKEAQNYDTYMGEQLMGNASDLKQMTEWPIILTEGGDDRLPLDPSTGTNKYHAQPYVASHALFRGSCTCNSPTKQAYEAANLVYHDLAEGRTNVE